MKEIIINAGNGLGEAVIGTAVVREAAYEYGGPVRLLTKKYYGPYSNKGDQRDKKNPMDVSFIDEPDAIWQNNPYVDSIEWLPDDWSWPADDKRHIHGIAFGHQIQNLCTKYGIFPIDGPELTPDLHLSEEEDVKFRNLHGCIIFHVGGSGCPDDISKIKMFWDVLAAKLMKSTGRKIIQVGAEGFKISCAKQIRNTSLRDLFAIISQCHTYIGYDSGPTHIATAFNRKVYNLFHADELIKRFSNTRDLLGTIGSTHWYFYPQNNNFIVDNRFDRYNLIGNYIIKSMG